MNGRIIHLTRGSADEKTDVAMMEIDELYTMLIWVLAGLVVVGGVGGVVALLMPRERPVPELRDEEGEK